MLCLDAQTYQWNCSPLNETDMSYKLPDLPLNDEVVAEVRSMLETSSTLFYHIFPLPPDLNCSGTVSSLRFCYSTSSSFLDQEQLAFTLLIMKRNGLDLNITHSIAVHSTPREEICTRELLQYCCDTISLNMMDGFSLPSENFSFGISSLESTVRLLEYSDFHFPSLEVDHYRISNLDFPTPSVGSVYTLDDSDSLESDRALRLFQFIIGK